MNTVSIYTLEDPRTGLIKYLGKTKKPLNKRLSEHIKEGASTKKGQWIKGLLKLNLLPVIKLIDTVDSFNWQFWEGYWISQLKSWNFKLLNMTEGGDGNNNQVFSETSKLKRSASIKLGVKLGTISYKERGAKISQSKKGVPVKQETKNKISKKLKGQKISLATKLKKSKPILQLSLNNEVINEYYSLSEAARILKISKGAIQNACCGRRKTAGGFKWQYK